MLKKKTIKKSDIPEIKEEVVEEKKEVKVYPIQEYILKKDVNLSLKAGTKVDKATYDKLCANGLSGWF